MAERQPINYAAIKQFFETGQVPEGVNLGDLSLTEAAAIILRYISLPDPNENPDQAGQGVPFNERTFEQRDNQAQSVEVLSKLDEVDLSVIDQILNSDEIDKNLIVTYLKERGITEIPILTTMPKEVRDFYTHFFSAQIIPAGQVAISDLGAGEDHPDVPQWFYDSMKQKAEAQKDERVDIVQFIRERWFILATFVLALLTAYGFQHNLGIHLPELLSRIDLFLSLYGVITVTRAVVQLERAETNLKKSRFDVRSEYAKAFRELLMPDSDEPVIDPEIEELCDKVDAASMEATNWDPYQQKMGFWRKRKKAVGHGQPAEDAEEFHFDQNKQSFLDEYNEIMERRFNEQPHPEGETYAPVSRDSYLNTVTAKTREKLFPEGTPSAAVVIPTYQTSLGEMKRLLISVKDQAFPIRRVYVIYNDDVNDPKSPAHEDGTGRKITDKQAEYLDIQQLVDNLHKIDGRNNCVIELVEQRARGKREAMAMGFAKALGSSYLDDLKAKHPNTPEHQLRKMVANVDIKKLDDFRHDYIFNVDSDTEMRDPFTIQNAIINLHKHPKAACTTGDVRVRNRRVNLLTEMTYQRYRRAFFVERAAQGNQVTCGSGPLLVFKQWALSEILDDWYFQEQGRGKKKKRSTYGDDRNGTTNVLKHGWESLFTPDAAVETDSPTDWTTFLKQQLRWNKSFNRENFLLLRFIHKLDKYVQFDVVYQQTFPFAMLYILGNVLLKGGQVGITDGAIEGAKVIAPYIFTIIAYNELFFGLYGMLTNEGDKKYFLSPAYIDYHFGALLWLKLRAIAESGDTAWGTKGMTVEKGLNIFQQNKGRILLELHQQIVSEVENPDFDKNKHKPYDVPA